jgi:hypothetical protein
MPARRIYIDTERPRDASGIEMALTTGANGERLTEMTHAASRNIFQRNAA